MTPASKVPTPPGFPKPSRPGMPFAMIFLPANLNLSDVAIFETCSNGGNARRISTMPPGKKRYTAMHRHLLQRKKSGEGGNRRLLQQNMKALLHRRCRQSIAGRWRSANRHAVTISVCFKKCGQIRETGQIDIIIHLRINHADQLKFPGFSQHRNMLGFRDLPVTNQNDLQHAAPLRAFNHPPRKRSACAPAATWQNVVGPFSP